MKKFPDLRNPIHFIASLGPIGKIPFAPGTWGSLFSCVLFIFISHFVNQIGLLIIIISIFAIYICDQASKDLINKDHKSIVIDELAGMWVALYPAIYYDTRDERVAYVILAFILFRIFDILKPFPISYLDKNIEGGFGIVIDDIVAGLFAGFITVCLMIFLFV
jgi:phosphatidylglycerophosphatase A